MALLSFQNYGSSISSFFKPVSTSTIVVSRFPGKRLIPTPPTRKTFAPMTTPSQQSREVTKSLFSIFQTDEVDIPQNDPRQEVERAAKVEENQKRYIWTHDAIEGASLIKGFAKEPIELGWVEKFIPIFIRVVLNKLIYDTGELTEVAKLALLKKISNFFSPFLAKVADGSFCDDDQSDVMNGMAQLLSTDIASKGGPIFAHKEMFKVIKLDVVGYLDQFLSDDIFGWYRVAGPNPMRLTKVENQVSIRNMFPELTDDILRGIDGFGSDTIAAMLQQNRLYFVSYPEFQGVPTGRDSSGNIKKNYLYAPNCLLGIPKSPTVRQSILPLAIRCDQNKDTFPVYTANNDHTAQITWQAAKATVQVADAVIHETVYHLARTHLLVGIFICATHRALPDVHPIFRLLDCHSYGTAFINNLATTTLINPGGIIDEITAPDISKTLGVAANGVNGKTSMFNDWFPDVDLKNRGVIDPKLKFPYRDDALSLWDAILEWVAEYLSAYYKSDRDVVDDYELMAWCAEISGANEGNLHGFGDNGDGKITTKNYLIRAVAMIIFSATVQHAAVNFPQSTLMQFSPSMPLAGYYPAIKTPQPFSSTEELSMKMFPALDKSYSQLQTAEIIGVLSYGQLGKYNSDLNFAPGEVDKALGEFADRLGIITAKIRKRNMAEKEAGLPPYDYLVPDTIPKSINI